MRKKILRQLKRDVTHSNILSMARRIKVPYACLYRIVKETGNGSLKTWDKIKVYYGFKDS